jgi:hypothetical protein
MAEHIASSRALGKQICDVLGLDANRVGRMTIDIDPSKAAIIRIVRYLTEQECDRFADEISTYELHQK